MSSQICYYDEDGAKVLVRKPFGWVFICPFCEATKKLPTIKAIKKWAESHIADDERKLFNVLEELAQIEATQS